MVTLYLVRHGEADYSEMLEKGFYGFGRSFAPLSEKGCLDKLIMKEKLRK